MFRRFVRNIEPLRRKFMRLEMVSPEGGGGAGAGAGPAGAAGGKEQQLSAALRRALPGITYVSVQDISGGCGAMFEVSVEAKEFKGLSTVRQHRLVTDSLRAEIAEMHGIRIHTSPPSDPPLATPPTR